MQLRRDFLLSVGVLVACNILLAFVAIGLLTRMSPAFERILRDNVYSNEAATEMLALLAEPIRDSTAKERQRRFESALQRAKSNITESEEVVVLARLEQQYGDALAGDASAVVVVVQALTHLTAINRRVMVSAEQEAQRLGTAGAWVAVFIAVFSFVISSLIIRRLERQVLNPLVELHDVLEAVHVGNRHRRCRVIEAPEEIRRVLSSINALLDRYLNDSERVSSRGAPSHATIERSALMQILEQQTEAMVLVDEHGAVVAANNRGLAVLGTQAGESVRQLLSRLPFEPIDDASVEPIALKGGAGWLCVLHG
jgi:PAS domain-containing protein